MRLLFSIFIAIVLLFACKKDKVGYAPTPVVIETPSHFAKMEIPADNPFTKEGIALGRKLFHEVRLSLNNTLACASCHGANTGFSDSKKFSIGVGGEVGTRQSMALVNLGWQSTFFWDGRALTIEQQILGPVPNPIEMHLEWTDAVDRLMKDINYSNDFYRAFGTKVITKELVAKAIAQFLRTMISGGSKFDAMYKFSNGLALSQLENIRLQTVTPDEWAGYDSFKSLNGADCFHCHNGPNLQVQKFSNNGLDAVFSDLGRGAITNNSNDNGKFKAPSLRNIALTAPYMHDGRFATLEEVIEHYSSGIQASSTIDPKIEYAAQGGVQLDAIEKMQLKAFLETLTDYDFINNPDFKKPH
jgi:cytochrome c peroxidase